MGRNIKDSEQTKKRILIAAKKEFAEKGFNGARMSSIATRAGINQALLHYHFVSKDNLYLSIFHAALGSDIDILARKINEEIHSWNTTPEKELCAAIYLLVSGHIETHDDDLNRIFAREIADGQGLIHDFARKYMLPRIMLFEDIIKKGIQSGVFEISNSLMFTISLISFVTDYVHGEDYIKGTRWHKTLYKDKKNTLFNYLLESSFKILTPIGKKTEIPRLSEEEVKKLDIYVNDIINLYTIK